LGSIVEADRAQVAQVIVVERELLEEVQAILETGGNEEPSMLRELPDVQAERGRPLHAATEIAHRHVQLVEVGAEPAGHGPNVADLGRYGRATYRHHARGGRGAGGRGVGRTARLGATDD